jgi:hypothetical protein
MMRKVFHAVPTITNRIPIALRAYAKPKVSEAAKAPPPSGKKPKRKPSTLQASPWAIVFDTETTTGPEQALRFGTYQVRNNGVLFEAGIFYDAEGVSAAELDVVGRHAQANDLRFLTRDEFADQIFYKIGYQLRAAFVGFNLSFDISRIAIDHGSARTEMRGGFTFQLSKQKYWPRLQVKHISQKCAFIRFAAPMRQLDNRSDRRRGRKNGFRRGHFIDLKTLAGALFARSFSLAGLSAFLKVKNPKLEFDNFDGPITDAMLTYAVRDVQATWECYVELISRYEKLGIAGTPPEKIYSEASIGKAYLKDMGIEPWRKCQPNFPDQLIANIMGSYFGGRSEVCIRREMRQVVLCDFLSMYPTVCTLMGLWRFVIAQGMEWADTTAKTRAWLEKIELRDLQSKSTWQELLTLVRVRASSDIFPVRAAYGSGDQTTIAANFLTSRTGLWFTLADCTASKLLTGKAPEVLEAITFTPMQPQLGLKPVHINGRADYAVNAIKEDFFKRVIELRDDTKTRRDMASGHDWDILDTEQNGFKIAANATSYGVFVEVNVADQNEATELTVYSGTDQPFEVRSDKVEETGPLFHPILASFITSAARLTLAITEHLVERAGLEWAFCDTDSMAIAKPPDMPLPKFQGQVQCVVDWFDELNPYGFKAKLLKIEDVNFDYKDQKARRPLYCWAVSAKRYVLFNLDGDGKCIIRKASGHGLGHLQEPYNEKNPAHGIPKPLVPVHKIGKGFKLWQHDIWWQIICAALDGHPDQVDFGYHPALELPAISRYAATTPELLAWFKAYNKDRNYRDQVKPFGFLTALTAKTFETTEYISIAKPPRRRKAKPIKPIAPYTRDPAQAEGEAFDRETGLKITPNRLKSFRQVLAQYHLHPESKFVNGDYLDRGTTQRRHVEVSGILHIGKEANRLEEQATLGIDEKSNPDYGMAPDHTETMLTELRGIADVLGRRVVANEFGITKSKLVSILTGKRRHKISAASLDQLRTTARAVAETRSTELSELRSSVGEFGLRATAKLLGCDASNLKRRIV